MKIQEVMVVVHPDNDFSGNQLRVSVRVQTDNHLSSYVSQIIPEDDFKSMFDILIDEAKRHLLKEMSKPCPESEHCEK